MDSKQWEFDKFHEDSYELAKNAEINKFKSFLQLYSSNLYNLEESLHKLPYNQLSFDLDPINLEAIPYEQGSLLHLVKTDNKMFNKIVIVFAALSSEIDFLVQEGEKKYFWGLLLYGEGPEVSLESGQNLVQMANFVSFLQELSCFVKRCYEVVRNVLYQLNALYSVQKAHYKIDTTEMRLKTIFLSMGNLLRVLITIDSIIEQHPKLKDDWNAYKRMIKSVHHNPNKFEMDINKFYRYEKHLIELEGKLLDGYVFQNCVEQIFDEKNQNPPREPSKNSVLCVEFFQTIKQIFDEIEPTLNESLNTEAQYKFVGVCALTVLYNQIYRNLDKRFFKSVWDTFRKAPVIVLNQTTPWFSNDFFLLKVPSLARAVDKNPPVSNQTTKQSYFQLKNQSLAKLNQEYSANVSSWMIKMQAMNELNVQTALSYEPLFLQGIEYATTISNTVSSFLNLAISIDSPITKSNILELCKLIELLKTIHKTYYEKTEFIAVCKPYILQAYKRRLLSYILMAKKRLSANKKYNEKTVDILSGLILVGNALNGPTTRERLLISTIGVCISNRLKTFRAEENVDELMKKLEIFSYLETKIRNVCDTSFLFWHYKILLPIYLNDLYENTATPNKIHYMVWSLRESFSKFNAIRHTQPDLFKEKHLSELLKCLKKDFLDRISRDIETDLRLSIHLDLKSDESKAFKDSIKDLYKFVHIQPLVIHDKYVDIRQYVVKYLERTFYDLTTVALHDWKAYSEMRNLAYQKYSLSLIDPYLPSSTLEQGLDVLEIMRNIHIFVTRYLYNLNNQIFVEKNSQNKHLNTINIRHIANSIRTHGIGIMNTTINFTYQYLRKQFYIFSKFLFDEHIKSKLIRDIAFFKENKAALDQKYPYERAEKFNKNIRKLGVLADNQTYLDQFRLLISHIGNAMGYVRMIRSGGLNFCSNSIRFVPDLDDIINFEQYCNELKVKLSDQTNESAKNLDLVLSNLVKNFSEGSDYFKILVDVFANEFRSAKNMHLKNFYIILPSLTLNYVEYMIGCKEKLNKKNSSGAAFTDDGFAIGVSYILKLLDQHTDFDSLHWFQSVREKFAANRESITTQQRTQPQDDKLVQTQALTLQRFSTYMREFELLQCAMGSAQIFFLD